MGTGPDLSLVSNLFHISSRAQKEKKYGGEVEGREPEWSREKRDRETQEEEIAQRKLTAT